nr:hypothetical protein BgiMline_012789 [Biomphalaria glabrata]
MASRIISFSVAILMFIICLTKNVGGQSAVCDPYSQFKCCEAGMPYNKRLVKVQLSQFGNMDVVCDTKTQNSSGWILIQRIQLAGSLTFRTTMNLFASGFGRPCGDYWLGLDNMNRITSSGNYMLLIEMRVGGVDYWAKYTTFKVGSWEEEYRLTVSGFSGNVPDKFSANNGANFSTPAMDNDSSGTINCARKYNSGFWFTSCGDVNLNGLIGVTITQVNRDIVGFWAGVTTGTQTFSLIEMKIKRW